MLYIVSTPIGNMQDMTLRAVKTLKTVDGIVCEDTRQTGKLLNSFNIDKKMYVLNEFNEETKTYEYLEMLKDGRDLALVSDSGTPLVSDPGFKLVREALGKGINVSPIPGPTAVVAALSVSGLPTDSFLFTGFLPRNKTNKVNKLETLKNLSGANIYPTIIFYETPHGLNETIKLMEQVFGDIEIVVARELTKIHEEVIKTKLSETGNYPSIVSPKGEFVVLFNLKNQI